jgi:diaminohydroxyphosphoribosylaminopyrimidine deaminase/5-amino-6-(5-phosphoribosylamino)uracil reductase
MDVVACMRRALELAEKGRGHTATNPLVGAVIYKDGKIVGEGYHHFYGGDHAEVDAIKQANDDLAGATMFVSLEPCSHYGKTPPCARTVAEAGIDKVYVAMVDPNPKVSGSGLEILKKAGIEVEVGILEEEARRLNEAYIKYITTDRPFVIAKIAQTLDGRIADFADDSKWITGESARQRVQQLRSKVDAVLIGANTARVDNPDLTSHGMGDRDPLRLVLSSTGKLSSTLRLFANNSDKKTTLVAPAPRLKSFAGPAWEIEPNEEGNLSLVDVLKRAGSERICSLLIEGGTRVFSGFVGQGLIDKYIFVIGPKLLGSGKSYFQEKQARALSDSISVRVDRVDREGADVWIEAYPRK